MTKRERSAMWAGAAFLLAVLGLRGAPIALRAVAARLDVTRAQAVRASEARQMVTEAPARQAVMRERLRALVDLAPALLGSEGVAEGAATLTGELSVLAMRHRLSLQRIDPQPDSVMGVFVAVTVRFHAETDIAGLTGFLVDVEAGPRLLSLTELGITADEGSGSVERLRVDGALRGYVFPRRTGS